MAADGVLNPPGHLSISAVSCYYVFFFKLPSLCERNGKDPHHENSFEEKNKPKIY